MRDFCSPVTKADRFSEESPKKAKLICKIGKISIEILIWFMYNELVAVLFAPDS